MNSKISSRQFEIIEATAKILTRSGISGLTIKNLAYEMNFTEGAIYRHFKGKEEIIIAMIDYLAENMEERFSKIISENKTDEENLKNVFLDQFSFFQLNTHFVTAVFSDGFMEESFRINEAILKIMSTRIKFIKPLIESGQKLNVFTNAISSEEILHILMGSNRLLMYKWRVNNFQFDLTAKGNEMIESIFTLIRTNTNNIK